MPLLEEQDSFLFSITEHFLNEYKIPNFRIESFHCANQKVASRADQGIFRYVQIHVGSALQSNEPKQTYIHCKRKSQRDKTVVIWTFPNSSNLVIPRLLNCGHSHYKIYMNKIDKIDKIEQCLMGQIGVFLPPNSPQVLLWHV